MGIRSFQASHSWEEHSKKSTNFFEMDTGGSFQEVSIFLIKFTGFLRKIQMSLIEKTDWTMHNSAISESGINRKGETICMNAIIRL